MFCVREVPLGDWHFAHALGGCLPARLGVSVSEACANSAGFFSNAFCNSLGTYFNMKRHVETYVSTYVGNKKAPTRIHKE